MRSTIETPIAPGDTDPAWTEPAKFVLPGQPHKL